MSFTYLWADCTVASDQALPELVAGKGGQSVDIVVQHQPFAADTAVPRTGQHWQGGACYTLDAPVARFVVRNGTHVLVQPYPESDPAWVRLFLFSSVFAALAIQRGIFQLHCSAIATDVGALAFAADSGHGKSTLIAHLAARGRRVLADDTLPLQVRPQNLPLALPSIRRIKLLPDAVAALGLHSADLPLLMPGQEKRALMAADEAAPHPGPLPLAALYLLERAAAPTSAPTIVPVTGLAALAAIRANAFRAYFALQAGRVSDHMSAAIALAATVPVFRLIRPWDLSRMDETLDLLDQHHTQLQHNQPPSLGDRAVC